MSASPCKGTALRTHKVTVRLVRQRRDGPMLGSCILADRVADIRKALRSDASLSAIAADLGCSPRTLMNFIRRRNICNLKDRRDFINLKRSLSKPDKSPHSSDVEQPHCRRTRGDSSPPAGTISESQAKATEGSAGMAGAQGPVRRSTAGTGLRVGEASADLPATSEVMDVTARRDGQPNSDGFDIPDFLRRAPIEPETPSHVITKANENIAGAE